MTTELTLKIWLCKCHIAIYYIVLFRSFIYYASPWLLSRLTKIQFIAGLHCEMSLRSPPTTSQVVRDFKSKNEKIESSSIRALK